MINDQNEQKYQDTIKFRAAAIADGWSHKPIYPHESEDSASQLERDGWIMQVYNRKANQNGTIVYDSSISIWAPDGISIVTPSEYNFEKIVEATMYCGNCKTRGVKTVRISFAGRCCEKCRPMLIADCEPAGWAD